MTRKRPTPTERLAATRRDDHLADIVARAERSSSWDRFIVEQAVFTFGLTNDDFSANSMRAVLPDLAHGFLGAAMNGLRAAGILHHTGRYVPSTSPATHGHPVAVWQLSDKGRAIAKARRNAVVQPTEVAA